MSNSPTVWNSYFSAVMLLSIIVATILLRPVKEDYHLKHELWAILAAWLIVITFVIVYDFIGPLSTSQNFTSLVVQITGVLTYISSSFFLFCVLHKESQLNSEKEYRQSVSEESPVEAILNSPDRDAFLEYVARHFCLENVKFIEEIMMWKAAFHSSDAAAWAQDIFEKFLRPGSEYEINISDANRAQVTHLITTQKIDINMFNGTCSEVVHILVFSSLWRGFRGFSTAYNHKQNSCWPFSLFLKKKTQFPSSSSSNVLIIN